MSSLPALHEIVQSNLPLSASVAALILGICLLLSYYQGPGWLAHSECPHCCWCTGRRPFGERAEDRIQEWLT